MLPAGDILVTSRQQEYFLGVNTGGAYHLPPSCAVVTKSGSLNFLEPSGHLGPVMGLIYLYLRSRISKIRFNLLELKVK